MTDRGLFDQEPDLAPEPMQDAPTPKPMTKPRVDPLTLPRGNMSDEQYKWIMWKFWGIEV